MSIAQGLAQRSASLGLAAALLISTSLTSNQASAANADSGLYLSSSFGGAFGTDLGLDSADRGYDSGWWTSFAIGYQLTQPIRLELEGSYSKSNFNGGDDRDSIEATALLFNGWYDFNANAPLSYYVGGGLGGAHIVPGNDANGLALQLGGGLKFKLNERFALNLDYRYFTAPSLSFNNIDASFSEHRLGVGISMLFAGTKSALDSDRDGVINDFDQCPNTRPGTTVDNAGCIRSLATDLDGDGVAEAEDRCPNTPKNALVDHMGCTMNFTQSGLKDDDLDGVVNASDNCPKTDIDTPVGSDGCPRTGKGLLASIVMSPSTAAQVATTAGPNLNNGTSSNRVIAQPNTANTILAPRAAVVVERPPLTVSNGIPTKPPVTVAPQRVEIVSTPARMRYDQNQPTVRLPVPTQPPSVQNRPLQARPVQPLPPQGPVIATNQIIQASADQDQDGVPDEFDHCPSSIPKLAAMPNGCSVGQRYILSNVGFQPNSAALTSAAKAQLNPLARMLQTAGEFSIKLTAHTNTANDDNQNYRLSKSQAEAVAQYLAGMGVSPARMITVGYGAWDPIVTDTNGNKASQNQRVELEVLKQSNQTARW